MLRYRLGTASLPPRYRPRYRLVTASLPPRYRARYRPRYPKTFFPKKKIRKKFSRNFVFRKSYKE